MRFPLLFLVAVVLFVFSPTSHAGAPDLESGVKIDDGGQPLDLDRYLSPCVGDWNNDGKKDLLLGQFTDGWIWLYLNQGTDINPLFNSGSLVESGGQPITVTYG